MDTKELEKPRLQLRENWFFYSSIYTVAWMLVPIGIYSSDTLFKRFCAFHAQKLNLKNKNTAQLFLLAVGCSFFYSTISLNIYYRGLLKIIGLSSIYDIEGQISREIIEKYNLDDTNNGLMQEIEKTKEN